MAFQQTATTSFKQDLLLGTQALTTDVLKMALYTANASLDAATTAYTTTGEVPAGLGYSTGGEVLVNVQVIVSDTTTFITFNNPTWPAASFTARGALIYNVTKSNKSIVVLDFGSDKTAAGTFVVQLPAATAAAALIRVA